MPLTKPQLEEVKRGIDQAEKAMTDATADIATAKRAGIDVLDMEKELKDVRERVRKMKAVYR